jgi:RNA polymerase sigma factor (sigma-70 family)
MYSDENLIKECLAANAEAQKELYERFAPKFWPVCLRFAKNQMSAEDIMQEGLIRIFRYLEFFKGEGSFEVWMRRIMVNTAINYYKKNLKQNDEKDIDSVFNLSNSDVDAVSKMTAEEILAVVQTLPDGYRTIFNLHIMEGYPHKEIAEMLGVTESTSKSQLSRARAILQIKINKIYGTNYGK